jgi:hypothetical protein
MGGKQLGISDYELTKAKKQNKREMVLSDRPILRKGFTPLICTPGGVMKQSNASFQLTVKAVVRR